MNKKIKFDQTNEEFNDFFRLLIMKLYTWCIFNNENLRKDNESNAPCTINKDLKLSIEYIHYLIEKNYATKRYSNHSIMLKVCSINFTKN